MELKQTTIHSPPESQKSLSLRWRGWHDVIKNISKHIKAEARSNRLIVLKDGYAQVDCSASGLCMSAVAPERAIRQCPPRASLASLLLRLAFDAADLLCHPDGCDTIECLRLLLLVLFGDNARCPTELPIAILQ